MLPMKCPCDQDALPDGVSPFERYFVVCSILDLVLLGCFALLELHVMAPHHSARLTFDDVRRLLPDIPHLAGCDKSKERHLLTHSILRATDVHLVLCNQVVGRNHHWMSWATIAFGNALLLGTIHGFPKKRSEGGGRH